MVEKYNKLYLLIHPLYDLFIMRGFSKQAIFDLKENPIVKQIRSGDKRTINILKTTLGIYGDQINLISADKNAMLILFEPRLKGYDHYSNKISLATYNKHLKDFNTTLDAEHEIISRFDTFIKNKLNERVIISNYNPYIKDPEIIATPSFMKKAFLSKLNKEVNVYAFGEYRNQCVSIWGQAIENKLIRFGIKPKLHLINNKSLYEKLDFNTKFRKSILPKHKKRELQQTNKKLKLKLNQMIKKQLAHI